MSSRCIWKGLALECILIATACAGTGPPRPDRTQAPGAPVVESLSIEGNSALSEAELLSHMLASRPGRMPFSRLPELDEIALAEDRERIETLYHQAGYYEARARYELDWNQARTAARVRFSIEEGEPVLLDRLAVELASLPGSEQDWSARLLGNLPLEEGSIFELADYRTAKDRILRSLADAGYPRASLAGGAEVDLATHRVVVRWRVLPSSRVCFGQIHVTGLERVNEDLVRQELVFAPGDLFSRSALEQTQRRVYGLRLFRTVVVESKAPAAAEGEAGDETDCVLWPVDVQVSERPPRSIEAGAGYGTEEHVRARLAWLNRNLYGSARSLQVAARYSSLLTRFESSLEQRRFVDPLISLKLTGSLESEDLSAYKARRARAGLELRRPLVEPWSGVAGYVLEWNDIKDVSPDTNLILDDPEDQVVLSYLRFGLERSTLDDPRGATRGTWLDLSLELSPLLLGSQASYVRAGVDARGFLPLWKTVLATRVHFEAIQPYGPTSADEIPLVTRLFSGGSNSVRGFDYQHLGPLDASGEPVGGTTLQEASVELRFPVWRELGAVLFVDAGRIDLEAARFGFGDVFVSVGTGIRYRTPIGPLRVDFGYVLNAEERVDHSRVHLSIGHAF